MRRNKRRGTLPLVTERAERPPEEASEVVEFRQATCPVCGNAHGGGLLGTHQGL